MAKEAFCCNLLESLMQEDYAHMGPGLGGILGKLFFPINVVLYPHEG